MPKTAVRSFGNSRIMEDAVREIEAIRAMREPARPYLRRGREFKDCGACLFVW